MNAECSDLTFSVKSLLPVENNNYRGPSRATRLGAHLPYFCRILDEIHHAKAIGNHWGFDAFLD